MSKELQQFFWNRGISQTRSSPYNPRGNGQCERTNGTLWKAIQLALSSQNLPESHWESLLDQALHSLRSLLCTATNETPHERLFAFTRKSANGYSMLTWLSAPNKVLLRKFVRNCKSDPLTEKVDLLYANPNYATIRYSDGRESTVSTRDLAPPGQLQETGPEFESTPDENKDDEARSETETNPDLRDSSIQRSLSPAPDDDLERRSTRYRQAPDRLGMVLYY